MARFGAVITVAVFLGGVLVGACGLMFAVGFVIEDEQRQNAELLQRAARDDSYGPTVKLLEAQSFCRSEQRGNTTYTDCK